MESHLDLFGSHPWTSSHIFFFLLSCYKLIVSVPKSAKQKTNNQPNKKTAAINNLCVAILQFKRVARPKCHLLDGFHLPEYFFNWLHLRETPIYELTSPVQGLSSHFVITQNLL